MDINSNIQMFKWKTDKEFYSMTICSADLTLQAGEKAAGFESVWICISSN